MDEPILTLSQVSKEYRIGEERIVALESISLTINARESVVLIGESGSGKSTLLNIVSGMDRPTSGQVLFRRQDLAGWTATQLADYRRTKLGVIFQSYHLLPTQSAVENVEWPLILAGVPLKQRREQAAQALADVGLADRLRHRPHELSGGQQQRVAIARALIHHPCLLVADEPTGNLDAATSREVMELLYRLVEQLQMTFLLVTHEASLQHRPGCRTVRLSEGSWQAESELKVT